jgi:hypothetical protein
MCVNGNTSQHAGCMACQLDGVMQHVCPKIVANASWYDHASQGAADGPRWGHPNAKRRALPHPYNPPGVPHSCNHCAATHQTHR